jgi:hypothetical protein
MSVMMIRATVKPENVDDLKAAVTTLFAALSEAAPRGVRYSSQQLPDATTWVIQLELEDPANNPLGAIPEFQQFQAALPGWLVAPPVPEQLTTIGEYRSF